MGRDGENKRAQTLFLVRLGMLLTFLYLFAVALHVGVNRTGFREISQLELNSFGDFLAGVFAPLAFLWVVLAVFIQKEELEAQLAEFRASNEQLSKQYAISQHSFERGSMSGKFALLSRECLILASMLFDESDDVEELHRKDLHPEAIAQFVARLGEFVDLHGGLNEWQRMPTVMIEHSDRLLYHLSIVADQVQQLREWLKSNDDDEIRSKMLDADIQHLERFVYTLQLHLSEESLDFAD